MMETELPTTRSRQSLFSRLAAIVLLVVSAPVVAISALVVKLSSPGPALFRADRVGIHGSRFTMYKLRTMHVRSESQSAITANNDPRVFPAGALLRRLKVDEVPQLVNVVKGEMCFFGPRPEDPRIVEEAYEPWMWETLEVLPGIVGPGSLGYFVEESSIPQDPAEVEAYYGSILLPRKLARELLYVRNPSRSYRFSILARTLLRILNMHSLATRANDAETERALALLAEVSDTRP